MRFLGFEKPPISPETYEGDLYDTPRMARETIQDFDYDQALPFLGFVRRDRAAEAARAARRAIPRQFEEFSTHKLTGVSGMASVYITRKIANETQPVAQEIRSVLQPATHEGTYRALGLGGWHVTLAKALIDMDGMSREEFIEDMRYRLENKAERLLVPLGGVAIIDARVCGNQYGRLGSSRFIGLTPHPKAGLGDEMREVKLLLDPMADTDSKDWFNTPHISVAKAEDKLFGYPVTEQERLECSIRAAVAEQAAFLRPLTLTSACVELSDPRF